MVGTQRQPLRSRWKLPMGKLMNHPEQPQRGRPPIEGETATGQIQLRTTMARKNAYVKAAKPKKLTAWIFEHLDKAAGYEPDTKSDSTEV